MRTTALGKLPRREPQSVMVEVRDRLYEAIFDEEGEPAEIRMERWARYTTGKRYWVRCWTPERLLGERNSAVLARARAILQGRALLVLLISTSAAFAF